MSKKKNKGFVEDWENLDLDAPEEEPEKNEIERKKPRGSALPKQKKPKKQTATIKKEVAPAKAAPSNEGSAEAHEAPKAPPKPKKSPLKKIKRRLKKRVNRLLKRILPKRLTLSDEEYEKYRRKKLKRKKEEEEFKAARKQLSRRRKAARKAITKRGKQRAKNERRSNPRQKRGFFASVWSLFDRYYALTTNPEEKENRIKPKIFGRTLTYTGFMILMLALIVVIFLVLNNRTLGVDRQEIVVTGLSDDFKGYNILIVSDLNGRLFGEDQSTLQRLLASENYSLVLMLGDMVGSSGDTEPFYELIDLFVSLRKPVYFIAGDSDPSPLVDTPRYEGVGQLTWREMVLSDWVLGAVERGAVYLDRPVAITRGASRMWLVPDSYLNLNVTDALNSYKDAYNQEQEAYNVGIEEAMRTLPLTFYRRNLLDRTRDNIINAASEDDLVIMLSHEVPSDTQLSRAQEAKSESDKKNYFLTPDLVFAGHYCGGEWKLPLIGTLYVDSSILPRYGWFPNETYVQGQRSVGGTVVYTTQGLGNNSETILSGRLNNPPSVGLITLTGELPASLIE